MSCSARSGTRTCKVIVVSLVNADPILRSKLILVATASACLISKSFACLHAWWICLITSRISHLAYESQAFTPYPIRKGDSRRDNGTKPRSLDKDIPVHFLTRRYDFRSNMLSLSITISPNHKYVGVSGFGLEV